MGSPLHIATIHAHKEVVGLLLSAGALPSMQRNVHMKKWYMCRCNDMGCGHCKFMTPIEYAVDSIYMERIAHKRNPEHLLQCIDTILNAGANNEDAELVLREAARLDNISLLKKVLEGDRPISTVPLSKNISAIEMCIDAGIPIDNRRFQLYALQQGSRELMKYLLTKSRPLLPVSIMGEIIWWLVDRNFFDLAELLIEVYAVNIDQVWTIDFSFDYSDFKEFSCWFAPSKELLWQDCNLLQRAVTTYYPTKDQIRFVLECGALVECPGLPLNALEYCKEAAKISELDCFRLLLEYAKKQDFLHIPVVCERVSSVTSSSTAPDNHESLIWHFARSELATPGLGAPDSQAALAIEVEADGIRSTVKQLAASNLAEVPKSPSTQTLDIPARDSAQDVLDAMSAHRTAVDQSLHPFIHQPLEGLHFIRLFELELSTSTHDPIRGHLKHVNLSEAPHFEALSYVWGDARVKIPIILGDSRFEVTLNLWNALFRMRGANSSQLLWIDSMCIDQQNEQEKSHQVQMMREIYLSADNVIIWLGEQSTSGENDLLHAVNSLDPELAQKALERIASKPWFYRTWTMQEIVLAKRATIKISGQTCDWGDIKSLKKTSESYSGSSYLPFHGLSPNQHLSRLRDLCSLDVNDPNSNTRTAQMFLYSSVCEATDPRDKVYGLLGMFEGPLINVDYTLGADIIYRRFTEAIIKRSGSLKILYKFGTKKTIDGLPSWVPDYSVSRPAGVIPECYNDWLEDQDLGLPRTIKFVDDALILTGIPFSKINATGDVLSEDTALGVTIGSEAFRKVLSGWESLACTLDANVFEQPLPICFLETITAQDYRQETVYNSAGMLDWYNKYGAGPTKLHDKQPFIDYQDRMELESWLSDSKDRETRQGESAMIITMPGNGAHPKVEEWGGRPKGGPEAHIARLTRRLEQVCYSRCFFTTEKGDMGLAPEGTQAGDVVVYFECGLFPFVLRQREDGKWKMVGGCFHYQREFTEEEIEGVNKALRESVAEFVIV
ncbi:heterokaryon incompatibility protein-domain-containing protein [Phaeosphaeriaceae sp. PMI808]|nr:heterokaryon incompatibility protein-domain-containing protein [Phaeosphaeriaceae sp. PMI808]